MPIPPPAATIPYDSVNTAMDMARVRLNDCPLALSGNLLANTQPYAQTIANAAWRQLQEDLADAGDPAVTSEIVLSSFPAVASTDPSVMTYINQAGSWNGAAAFTTPVLPQNFMMPLWLRERLAGSRQIFTEMQPVDDGLPGAPKTTYLRLWEWRAGSDSTGNQIPLSIWMPGATVDRDVWVRFASYLPDFTTVNTTNWYQQPIPIYRSADALAFYICAEFAFSRGSEQAAAVGNSFLEQGRERARKLINRQLKVKQRLNHRRRSYSSYRHSGWGWF